MAIHAQLKQRVGTERIGVVAIRVATGDLENPLGPQVAQGRRDIRRMALIVNRLDETVNQPELRVNAPPNQGAKV